MAKYFLLAFIGLLMFAGIDCKHNPVGPSQADTTSNNFTFQTFTFGASNAGGSTLQDVAIISDSDIWCVGAVYLDSADGAPDPFPYNVVHWDGQKWNLQQIPYHYQGQINYQPFRAIFSLSPTDIWFGGNGLMHWDGSNFSEVLAFNSVWGPYWVEKIWAGLDQNVYVVGEGGSIAWYNGSWTKLESGTTLNFYDIYGSGGQILAVASDPADNYNRKIVQLNGSTATNVSDFPIPWPLSTVWFVPNQHYYVAGNGMYDKNLLSDSAWSDRYYNVTQYYITSIRGNATDDIFAVGSFGEFLHWNGKSWRSFISETGLSSGAYGSIAVKGNLVIAVGMDGGQGVILRGVRQ